ncbi:MAG: hypothetical protein ACKOBV_01525, partial [Candidatus Kapaibacterium sp.]
YSRNLSAGVVITGGCSQMRGAAELAEQVFGIPVKTGIPGGTIRGGLAPEVQSPMYATAVGLVLYGLHIMSHAQIDDRDEEQPVQRRSDVAAKYGGFINRIKGFFEHL